MLLSNESCIINTGYKIAAERYLDPKASVLDPIEYSSLKDKRAYVIIFSRGDLW